MSGILTFCDHPLSGYRINGLCSVNGYKPILSHCKRKKVVPLHAMEALWVRGGIAPTVSSPRHKKGQLHAPAALHTLGKSPRYPLDRRLGGP
jgi:hypothetical protein